MANLTCGGRFAQIFLILLNTLVLLFGIAFLVVGLIFKFGEQKFLDEKIKPTLGDIKLEGNSLYYLADAFTIIFIVVGAVLIAIAIIGLIGAGCLVRWMLVVYASFVILIFILEIVAVAFFFVMRREFNDTITTGMKESIKKANEGNKDVRDGIVYIFDSVI
ncbi:hypothetical protein ACJMK2_026837 [Sinanodonta woodiana]|uniref:Tetraspanin n=1 Tax=Sinanodonta woodiana TaxID=1069815 RepID=A0ABD3XMP5_SINWO